MNWLSEFATPSSVRTTSLCPFPKRSLDYAPTGKRFSVEHVHWHRLAGGKLVERWAVRDDLGVMQQLGIISMPGQTEEPSPT
jgi:hypothetical protein